MDIKSLIRDVPDFPKKGIIFKDITTLLKNKDGFKYVIDEMTRRYKGKKIDKIVGIESRGFIIGGALAYNLGVGFVPVRKKGKLPANVISKSYSLEYGEATLEIHEDAISKNERVIIVDDLLATGGTVLATIDLVEQLGGIVEECFFIIELDFLNGRENVNKPVYSLIHY